MQTQFEIKNNEGIIYKGTFNEAMHYWDLLIGQIKPITKEEKEFTALHNNAELSLIPALNN